MSLYRHQTIKDETYVKLLRDMQISPYVERRIGCLETQEDAERWANIAYRAFDDSIFTRVFTCWFTEDRFLDLWLMNNVWRAFEKLSLDVDLEVSEKLFIPMLSSPNRNLRCGAYRIIFLLITEESRKNLLPLKRLRKMVYGHTD